MTDSDDGINEHSIFDLDNAPPPPPMHRGVGRTLSPQQAKRGSYTLSPLKQQKEKLSSSSRSRIWSTDSAPTTTIKSIWSDNIMQPNSGRTIVGGGSGAASDKKPPSLPAFLERRNSSAGSGELEVQRERRLSEFQKSSGSFRNSMSIPSSTQQPQPQDNRRPSFKEFVLRSLSPQPNYLQSANNANAAAVSDKDSNDDDDDDASIRLRNLKGNAAPFELPFERSSGSFGHYPDDRATKQILLQQQQQRERADSANNIGEGSLSSLFSETDAAVPRRRISSKTLKVSFGSNSFHETGETSSRWSPELSDAQLVEEGEGSSSSASAAASLGSAVSTSEEVDYGYGEPVDHDDGIGLSTPRSSGLQNSMARLRTESQNSLGNWSQAQSDWSDAKNNDETEFDPDEHDPTTHQAMNARPSVVIAGVKMPKWVPPLPAVNDISAKVVTYCFCGCCCGRGARQLTDRAILGRLNVLIAILSVFPVCATAFLGITLYSPIFGLNRQIPSQLDTPSYSAPLFSFSESLWNMNGRMLLTGFFSLISGCAAVFTWRVVRDVNLLGAIRYLWVLVWILPCQLFCVISLFDRFNTTSIWINHFWRSPQMAWFRKRHCFPSQYYNSLCTVPDIDDETQWCLDNYNSTACVTMRDAAQEQSTNSLHLFYGFTAFWTLCQVFILLLAIHTLENIISKPLVQKSREANVPGWLSLPCLGCLALGGFLTFANQSTLSSQITNKESIAWLIGPMYIATGGCFALAAMFGSYISNVSILSTMDKRRKLLAVYLFTADMVLLVLLLLGIFGISIGYIVTLAREHVSNKVRGDFACNADYLSACTGCEQESDRCPEWSSSDVTSILQTQAKASATVAAIFVCYCFSSIRFGFVMMKRIAAYQIAYV